MGNGCYGNGRAPVFPGPDSAFFLINFRQGIGGGVNIPLKAAVTPTNRDWPLCQLAAELEKEHAAVQAARPAGE